jgi:hypothetical protein
MKACKRRADRKSRPAVRRHLQPATACSARLSALEDAEARRSQPVRTVHVCHHVPGAEVAASQEHVLANHAHRVAQPASRLLPDLSAAGDEQFVARPARVLVDLSLRPVLVEIREGDALESLARDLPGPIDGVLLDGHKPLCARVLALVAPRLRPGSFVVADNADACPDYLAQVRAPGSGYLSVPFADDVELTMKV